MSPILGPQSAANGDRWLRGLRSSTLCRVIGDILQPTHLIFVLVVALLVLGPKRLPEAGRSLGRGLRDFKDALSGDSDDRHVHEELTANDMASGANAQAAPAPIEHNPPPSVPVQDPAPSAPVQHNPPPSVPVHDPAPSGPIEHNPPPSVPVHDPAPSAPIEHNPPPSVPVQDPAPSAPAVHDPAPSASVQPSPADPVVAPGPAAASVGARSAEQSAHD